jgi:dTDP-4-dehydrorhamnose 3,5-epimerase-like enzyme
MSGVILNDGKMAFDDRGSVGFVNGYDFDRVKRFYTVRNHTAGFIRAWHGHRYEAKAVTVVQGTAIVACVKIDNWNCPDRNVIIDRLVMSGTHPQVLQIPAGYANGFKTLTHDAILMFFSTATVEESKGDDIRFPAHYWDPWKVEER